MSSTSKNPATSRARKTKLSLKFSENVQKKFLRSNALVTKF